MPKPSLASLHLNWFGDLPLHHWSMLPSELLNDAVPSAAPPPCELVLLLPYSLCLRSSSSLPPSLSCPPAPSLSLSSSWSSFSLLPLSAGPPPPSLPLCPFELVLFLPRSLHPSLIYPDSTKSGHTNGELVHILTCVTSMVYTSTWMFDMCTWMFCS